MHIHPQVLPFSSLVYLELSQAGKLNSVLEPAREEHIYERLYGYMNVCNR